MIWLFLRPLVWNQFARSLGFTNGDGPGDGTGNTARVGDGYGYGDGSGNSAPVGDGNGCGSFIDYGYGDSRYGDGRGDSCGDGTKHLLT